MIIRSERRQCEPYMFFAYILILFAYINIKVFILSPSNHNITYNELQNLLCDLTAMGLFPLVLFLALLYIPLYLFNISLYFGVSTIILWQVVYRTSVLHFISWSVLNFILMFLLFPIASYGMIKIRIGVLAFKQNLFCIYIIYLALILYMNTLQWYLICLHNNLNERILQNFTFIMMIFILLCNILISSTIFNYIICNIYMIHVLHENTKSIDTLSISLRNTQKNMRGILCHVFTFEYKGDHNRIKRLFLKNLALFFSLMISNPYLYTHYEQTYTLAIMAMFNSCDCGHNTVKRLNYMLKKFNKTKCLSTLFFNSKGMCISIASCLLNIYECRDFHFDSMCLDKEALFRLYRFFCWINCIILSHQIFEAEWKALVVLYIVDQKAVKKFSRDVARVLGGQ